MSMMMSEQDLIEEEEIRKLKQRQIYPEIPPKWRRSEIELMQERLAIHEIALLSLFIFVIAILLYGA